MREQFNYFFQDKNPDQPVPNEPVGSPLPAENVSSDIIPAVRQNTGTKDKDSGVTAKAAAVLRSIEKKLNP